jgi:hypothetical protein
MHELHDSTTALTFVQGLTYPISKSDILLSAGEMQLPDTIIQQLGEIPDREYASAQELTTELNTAS